MGNAATTGTIKLSVNLDITKNPQVRLSDRSPKGNSGDKIKWKKAPNAPVFTFWDFEPKSSPFLNVDIADDKIECDFEPTRRPPGEGEFPYTITVCYEGKIYTSDEKSPSRPTEGRAVIRN